MHSTRCFDIGGTKLVAADVFVDGTIHEQARFATPLHSFTDFVESLRANCDDDTHPVGVSVAGVIQPGNGLIQSANIPSINEKPLASELSQALSSIVVVGGGLANSGKLIDALDKEVAARGLTQQASPLLQPTFMGPEQGLLGAAIRTAQSFQAT